MQCFYVNLYGLQLLYSSGKFGQVFWTCTVYGNLSHTLACLCFAQRTLGNMTFNFKKPTLHYQDLQVNKRIMNSEKNKKFMAYVPFASVFTCIGCK